MGQVGVVQTCWGVQAERGAKTRAAKRPKAVHFFHMVPLLSEGLRADFVGSSFCLKLASRPKVAQTPLTEPERGMNA
jgi:hypothetical protein